MKIVTIVATHLVLYLATYWVLDFVEDELTPTGTAAWIILGASVPLSFLANLWSLGGFAGERREFVLRAAALTALISPLSATAWLGLYVKLFGYEG